MAKKGKAKKRGEPKQVVRLERALSKAKGPPPTGPMVTSAKIFPLLLGICRDFLSHHLFSESSRGRVAELGFNIRQEALRRFKHETVEAVLLAELTRTKPPERERAGRLDAISHINAGSNGFTVHEQEAAEEIQNIWRAFSRGLSGGGQSFSQSGGSRQNLLPADTMGQGLWDSHRKVYTPWYNAVKVIGIARNKTGEPVSLFQIVFAILVQDFFPETLDKHYELRPGRALRVLKLALAHYHSPERLKAALLPPVRAPKSAKIVATGGDSKEGAASEPTQGKPPPAKP